MMKQPGRDTYVTCDPVGLESLGLTLIPKSLAMAVRWHLCDCLRSTTLLEISLRSCGQRGESSIFHGPPVLRHNFVADSTVREASKVVRSRPRMIRVGSSQGGQQPPGAPYDAHIGQVFARRILFNSILYLDGERPLFALKRAEANGRMPHHLSHSVGIVLEAAMRHTFALCLYCMFIGYVHLFSKGCKQRCGLVAVHHWGLVMFCSRKHSQRLDERGQAVRTLQHMNSAMT